MPSHSSRDTSTSPDSWYSLWSLIWVSQPPRPQLFQSRQKNGLTYRRLDLRKVALPPLFKQMVDECRGKVLLRYEFFDLKEYLKGLVGRCPGVILTGDVGVGMSDSRSYSWASDTERLTMIYRKIPLHPLHPLRAPSRPRTNNPPTLHQFNNSLSSGWCIPHRRTRRRKLPNRQNMGSIR
jgi:hypothetical protein